MNPTLEQLARYVAQELQRGVPDVTLYASLRESGWTQQWINAAFSAARQHAMPVTNQMTIPAVAVQQQVTDPIHHHSMRPAPTRPLPVKQHPTTASASQGYRTLKKILIIVVVVLSAAVVGLSIYRTISGMQHAAEQRVIRDASRREDLSVLLSNLSDYYVSHNSYPTLDQMNTASFLETNGFTTDSITDPKWSAKEQSCTKDGKPALAGAEVANCYAYEVTTANNATCNNDTAPCNKVKVTIHLEVDKKAYSVTFDKNSQVD
jgi:hypothetical protein